MRIILIKCQMVIDELLYPFLTINCHNWHVLLILKIIHKTNNYPFYLLISFINENKGYRHYRCFIRKKSNRTSVC